MLQFLHEPSGLYWAEGELREEGIWYNKSVRAARSVFTMSWNFYAESQYRSYAIQNGLWPYLSDKDKQNMVLELKDEKGRKHKVRKADFKLVGVVGYSLSKKDKIRGCVFFEDELKALHKLLTEEARSPAELDLLAKFNKINYV